VRILAFRAIPAGSDRLTSYVVVEDSTGQSIKNISAEFSEELNVPRLIDPKITQLNGEFYITFNSGYVPGGNDIFIMRIYPEIGSPRRLIYRNRQKQERNWAFFSERGNIYALYRINPLTVLKLENITSSTWEMGDGVCKDKVNKNLPRDLSLGTQPFRKNGKFYFMAHKKLYLFRKKIYLGKCCGFDYENMEIEPGKYWWIHSLKSLLGSKVKHNTNLQSCTYFSGIQISGDMISLGYGVNDVECGFSTHNYADL